MMHTPISLEKGPIPGPLPTPEVRLQEAITRRELAEATLRDSIADAHEQHADHVRVDQHDIQRLDLYLGLPWSATNPESGRFLAVISLSTADHREHNSTTELRLTHMRDQFTLMSDTIQDIPTAPEAEPTWIDETRRAVRAERWAEYIGQSTPEKPTLRKLAARMWNGRKAVRNTVEVN